MSAPNVRVDTNAHVLTLLAVDITRALEHIHRELAMMDWHPADTMGSGGSSKGAPASPTERVALARSELTGRREDIRDWITGLEDYTRSGRLLVDRALRMRGPHTELFDATQYGKRCRHADCEQWASSHRLPHQPSVVIDDWCDHHWLNNACLIHGNHEHEQRKVQGVRCCQAAYRQHLRETTKEVA